MMMQFIKAHRVGSQGSLQSQQVQKLHATQQQGQPASALTSSTVSRAMPRSTTSQPLVLAADASMRRLASLICPGPRCCSPGSTSSSPVDSTPTTGFLYTCSWTSVTTLVCLKAHVYTEWPRGPPVYS